MRITATLACASAAALLSACATTTHQTAKVEAASTLAEAPRVDFTTAEAVARHSAAWGDKWTAANLYERAVDRENTVTGRFNLAQTYEATGRTAEAAELYRTLIRDGQFVWALSGVDYRNRDARIARFNVADESARRLAALSSRTAYAAATPGAAAAAAEFGTEVSAVVGGERVPTRRISDAEAQRLDSLDD